MGIGSSSGAFFEDDFHRSTGHDSMDDSTLDLSDQTQDNNEITPFQMRQNQQMDDVEMKELGGIPISLRTQSLSLGSTSYPSNDDNVINPTGSTKDQNEMSPRDYMRNQESIPDPNNETPVNTKQSSKSISPEKIND